MGGKPRQAWRQKAWEHWGRNNETFKAELTSLRTGRTRETHLRRTRHEPGIAFTVLDCGECGWRVYCEAHHRYGDGKPRAVRSRYTFRDRASWLRYKRWRTKMLKSKLVCPKCKHDTFRYVRTEVFDSKDVYSELAD